MDFFVTFHGFLLTANLINEVFPPFLLKYNTPVKGCQFDSQGLVFYLQYELRLADQRVQQIKNGRRPPFTFFRRNGQ